jgi:hypothetical protein
MSKLTDWISGDVKPVHVGVYKKRTNRFGIYQFWTGIFWGGWSISICGATSNKNMISEDQNSPWCGLANKPRSKP